MVDLQTSIQHIGQLLGEQDDLAAFEFDRLIVLQFGRRRRACCWCALTRALCQHVLAPSKGGEGGVEGGGERVLEEARAFWNDRAEAVRLKGCQRDLVADDLVWPGTGVMDPRVPAGFPFDFQAAAEALLRDWGTR